MMMIAVEIVIETEIETESGTESGIENEIEIARRIGTVRKMTTVELLQLR